MTPPVVERTSGGVNYPPALHRRAVSTGAAAGSGGT
jgi:hypothetical protein